MLPNSAEHQQLHLGESDVTESEFQSCHGLGNGTWFSLAALSLDVSFVQGRSDACPIGLSWRFNYI